MHDDVICLKFIPSLEPLPSIFLLFSRGNSLYLGALGVRSSENLQVRTLKVGLKLAILT